jgi:hypothetical protein
VARLKVMIADDRLGQSLDRRDRPKLAMPPHVAGRRVLRPRREATAPTLSPHHGTPCTFTFAAMKSRSHQGCSQIASSPWAH